MSGAAVGAWSPWRRQPCYEYDPARENEAWRGRIQKLVLEDLEARGIAYTVLTGSVQERAAQVRRVLGAS